MRRVASERSSTVLSFCGPFIVVALLLTWSILLAIGAALIVHPQLGTSYHQQQSGYPDRLRHRRFTSPEAASRLSARSNFAPQSAGTKLLFLLNSVIGTSVISLTITYLMQIYGALRSRNSLCLKIHALSGETGDAAELLAHLFANNQLSAGYNNLSELAAEVTEAKEAHHFYPILFYFRFPEPYLRRLPVVARRAGRGRADPKRAADRGRLVEAIRRGHSTIDGGAATPRRPSTNVFLQKKASVEADDADRPTLAHPVRRCTTAAAGSRHQRNGRSSAFDGIIYGTEKKVGSPSFVCLAVPWLISLPKSTQRRRGHRSPWRRLQCRFFEIALPGVYCFASASENSPLRTRVGRFSTNFPTASSP